MSDRARETGRRLRAAAAAALLLAIAGPARAQDVGTPEAQPPAALTPSAPAHTFFDILGTEAKRYGADSAALVTAPLQWNGTDWKKAAGFTAVLAGLFALDRRIDHSAQAHRSSLSNGVSSATTTFGAEGAFGVSGALLLGGALAHDSNTGDMGREALEASVITGLLNNLVLKPAFGRRRPNDTNGQTDFEPASRNQSFPSGHTTEAFSVASVVAMRAHGWVVPTLAYTAATLVAFDRVNNRAHFASDVFAGAVLGTVTGRFLVSRHKQEEEGRESKIHLDIQTIPHGLSAHILF